MLWLCYSLVGITLLLLLTSNLGVYVAISNEVSHIHWHPRKLNLRVIHLISKQLLGVTAKLSGKTPTAQGNACCCPLVLFPAVADTRL